MKANHYAMILLMFMLCGYSYAGSSSADKVLANMEEAHSKISTIAANLKQAAFPKDMEKQEAEGKLIIAKPGKLRIDYEKPEPQTLVMKDETVWIYTPSLKQVIKQKMDTSNLQQKVLLDLFGSIESLKKSYHVIFGTHPDRLFWNKGDKPYSDDCELVFKPKEKDKGLFEMKALMRIDTWLPVSIEVNDGENRLFLHLSEMKINEEIPEETFDFKTPEEAEVVTSPLE